MTQIPIPVHVGSEPPAHWDEIEANQLRLGDEASDWLRKKRRPGVADASLDWSALGFQPRWVGFDTADCAAALQPSIFSGQGADEFNRFRRAAESRGEVAIVISPVGHVDVGDQLTYNVFRSADDSVHLGRFESSISARSLGQGARAHAADHLRDADAQLALRLLNCDPPLPWRALSLHGVTYESCNGTTHHPAQGTLEPIVVTELGEPVVAAWVSPDGVERRYIVPVETPWPVLLQWLIDYGLPEYVPSAMRRARHHLATDHALMTRRERAAHTELTELEADYATRRADLTGELEEAKVAASAVRDGLLYGTGTPLVDTVRAVLESAGVVVLDLDRQLGGSKNADLLCTYAGRSRLVEVKSASGSASERLYQDLVRHLREWPSLPGSVPVEGGALVINHEHRRVPQERRTKPFSRPEFLAAQTEPVISTLDLFEAWREDDVIGIRGLLFPGQPRRPVADAASAQDAGSADPRRVSEPVKRKRGWFRGRSTL